MTYAPVERQTETELLATLLGRRTSDDAVARIAAALTVDGWMGTAPIADIARECGNVGPKSIARIDAAIELGRRALHARASRQLTTISTPEDVVSLLKPLMIGEEREMFFCICLDTRNHVKKIVHVSTGSLAASVVHPRELFRAAVAISSAAVVISHQHPGSDPTPSGADIQLTRRLVKAGDVLGIEVLDHVVIGGDGFASMRDLGLM